jgi:hypothetical protein
MVAFFAIGRKPAYKVAAKAKLIGTVDAADEADAIAKAAAEFEGACHDADRDQAHLTAAHLFGGYSVTHRSTPSLYRLQIPFTPT